MAPKFFTLRFFEIDQINTINFGVLGIFSIKQNGVSNYWHLALHKVLFFHILKIMGKVHLSYRNSQKNLQFCFIPQLCLKWIIDSRLIQLPKYYLRINHIKYISKNTIILFSQHLIGVVHKVRQKKAMTDRYKRVMTKGRG